MNMRQRLKKGILFPIKIVKKFSFKRLYNLFCYLHQEGIEGTIMRLKECVLGTEIYHQEIIARKVKKIKSLQTCTKLKFPYQEDPLVSVIIPVYNEFSLTYHCLKSILDTKDNTSYELIIADDCSEDLTMNIQEIAENITVFRTSRNRGFLRNCNGAAQKARGKYIFFLNNDTQVQDGWLDSQVELMEERQNVGLTGAKLIYPDGRLQEAGGIIWRDGSAWNYGNRKNPDAPEYNYVKEVDYVTGAAMMIRTKLWQQIGGFDERFAPAYCEDSDLAFEVRKAGYKVLYQPLSIVIHFEGMSNGTDIREGVKQYQSINQQKLCEKWSAELSQSFPEGENVFCARERSQKKKILLMIDHYVPTYDCDAGSRTVYEYMQLFIRKGFQVKFIGDNFHYNKKYTQALQQMGIEVLYGEYYKDHIMEWLEENHLYIDYVFLNRPHISIKYIDFFCGNTDCKVLYYGHDFHYLRCKREYELSGEKEKLDEAEEWREKELYLIRHADMSYYPSSVEVSAIRQIDSDLKVKPVTAYIFFHALLDSNSNFAERRGLLFVGGFAHTPNRDAVMWFVKEIYPLIYQEEQIPLFIVGSNPTQEIKKLDVIDGVTVKGFVSDEELYELYQTCKLAVVPLRYGAGVKGKVVEAMNNGIPLITTSIGAEGIPEIESSVCIRDKEEDFAQAVLRLYQEDDYLREMSKKEQKIVEKYYSLEAVWETFSSEFE